MLGGSSLIVYLQATPDDTIQSTIADKISYLSSKINTAEDSSREPVFSLNSYASFNLQLPEPRSMSESIALLPSRSMLPCLADYEGQLTTATLCTKSLSSDSKEQSANVLLYNLDLHGKNYPLTYNVTGNGNKLYKIITEKDNTTLLPKISTASDGNLTIELPRKVIDSKKQGNVDDDYAVLEDGRYTAIDEIKNNAQIRALKIDFDRGTEEIEIMGTQILSVPTTKASQAKPMTQPKEGLPRVDIPPIANNQTITTNEDTLTKITLTGSDADSVGSEALTYSLVHMPIHGILSATTPNLVYVPNKNYNGKDNFTFKVNDGLVDSKVATVNITVSAVNDVPIAYK